MAGMNRTFRVSALCAVVVVVAAVQTAHAATLTVRTDRENAIYARNEEVTFTILLAGEDAPAGADVNVEISTDGFRTVRNQTATLKDGVATVTTSHDRPGMVWVRATLPIEGAEPLRATAGAAVDPEAIEPSMPEPADFDEFWAKQLARLRVIEPNVRLARMRTDAEGVELYEITMDNINGTKIRGYLAKPVGEGPFPAMLQVQWAGVYSLQPVWSTNRASQGFLMLNINAHDMENGKPGAYYKEMAAGRLRGYPHQGGQSRDTSYFLRMYLSCVRAVDYLASRDDWDGKHLIVQGGSQGGGQALVTAGLSKHVTAVAANVPALCDHAGPAAGRAPGWPNLVMWPRDGSAPDEKRLQAARYFDAVNFARRIKAPALVGTGFADLTCPSSSVYAAYNQIPGPKRMIVDPLSGHGGAKPNWKKAADAFFRAQSGMAE